MQDDPNTAVDEALASNLARNLRSLRAARDLSQSALAQRCGVPRPTLAHLETGSGNPTLSVLARVAAALKVSIEELISAPRATGHLYKAEELPTLHKDDARLKKMLPEPLPGVDIDRMELPPGGLMRGAPHTPGTREYLFCERGQVRLTASGKVFDLGPGDVVVFRGDQPHAYRNHGETVSVLFSAVLLASP